MSKFESQNFDTRKGQIANTAAALFAKHGYHGASIMDIAKACGTAKSRLYYYFSSKEDLLYYLLKDHAGLLAFRLGGALSGQGSPQGQLLVYTKELLAINIRARDRHAIILSEMDKLSPVHRAEITALLRAPIEGLYDLLCAINPGLSAQEDKKFPAAMLLIGMINWSHTWFDAQGPVTPERYAQMICDTFIGGFATVNL